MGLGLGLILGAYLFGSFPFVYLLGRWRGLDLREAGSGNIGGGNLWQRAGAPWGLMGGLADVAKGALPVGVGRALGLDLGWLALAGLAGVVGQMWPPFLRFHGGRGNGPGLGYASTLGLWQAMIGGAIMLVGGGLWGYRHVLFSSLPWRQRLAFLRPRSRSVPLGMLLGFGSIPALTWLLGREGEVVLGTLGLFVLISVRRLTAGLRRDLGRKAQGGLSAPLGSLLVNRFLYDRPSP